MKTEMWLICGHCRRRVTETYLLYGGGTLCGRCALIEGEAWSWEYRLIHGEEGE
jgi:hypothetical protein